MSTYSQIIYHIVFGTKNRTASLTDNVRNDWHAYVAGIIKNKQSHLYRINSVSDHVHILTSLHPSQSLSDFVKDIKVSSTLWIKEHNASSQHFAWQDGYGAFTVSLADKDRLIAYIANQQEHHKQQSFIDELKGLLRDAGIVFDEKYLP